MRLFALPYPTWTLLSHVILFLWSLATAIENKDTPPTICHDSSISTPPKILAERKNVAENSIHFIGLFDIHEGSKCHLLRPGGVEEMMMTLGVVEDTLQDINYQDQGKIGLTAYDTCSSMVTAIHNLIYGLKKIDAFNSNCPQRFIGVMGPTNPEIRQIVENFLRSIDIPYFPLQIKTMKYEIMALAEVLLDLKWQNVALFSSHEGLKKEFHDEADQRNICISSSVVLASNTKSDNFLRKTFQTISSQAVQVAVILGSSTDLQKLFEMSTMTNSSIQYWLLAGVDNKDPILSVLFGPDHPVILFKKSLSGIPELSQNFSEAYTFDTKIKALNLVQSYIEYLNSCARNSSGHVFNKTLCQDEKQKLVNPLWSITVNAVENTFEEACQRNLINCSLSNETASAENVFASNNKMDLSQDVEIWTYQHAIGKFSQHKTLQVGHYSNGKLIWDKKRLNVFHFMGSGWFKIPEFYCRKNCPEICLNYENISVSSGFDNLFSRIYHWRHERWVTVFLTVSSVGVIFSLITIVYLITKSCKKDFEDGNHANNIIILIAIILSYSCTMLFMFHKDSESCARRVTIIGMAYTIMLAPILSRCCLMIAAELDGVHGHVSGFLQSVLCFFITAVQAGMSSCYWWMHTTPSHVAYKCTNNTKITFSYLSYPMILSLLWLIVSPFSARSRRNNREGLILHIGSIAVCVVWLAWYLLFFLLPAWNDFTICFGLVGTATAILVVVFLPKIYRMVTTAAADHAQVSMQPVIFASSSSRSPNLSIYESVNHGYNPDKDGYVVDVYRDDDGSPRPRKMTHL